MADFTPIGVEAIVKNLNKFISDLGKMDKSIQGTGKSASSVTSSFTGLSSALGTVGTVAAGAVVAGVVAAGAAIIGLGASSISAAVEMEQSVADIRAVFGEAAPPIKDLNNLVLGLGVDPGLKVTATEAANSIALLARNGLVWEDIAGGAAKASILMANATGGSFGQSADLATDIMALFNVKSGEMEEVVNGVTSVVNNSKFGFEEYAFAMAASGGVAAASGVSLKDLNTTIAVISPSFAKGTTAGTAYRAFLTRLIPTGTNATDAMRDLGLFTGLSNSEFKNAQEVIAKTKVKIDELDPSSKNFAANSEKLNNKLAAMESQLVTGNNAFFDAQGNMKDMGEVSSILAEATSGLSEEQRLAAFNTIFGKNAMVAAFAIADAGQESIGGIGNKFEEMQTKMAETKASEAVETRMSTLSGTMEILGGIFEAVKIRIGNAFLPALQALATGLLKLVGDNQATLIPYFESLEKFLTDNIPKATAFLVGFWESVLVPAFKIVSNFIGVTIPSAIKFLVGIWENTLLPVFQTVSNFITTTLLPIFNGIVLMLEGKMMAGVETMGKTWGEFFLPIILSVKNTLANFIKFWEQNGPAIQKVAEQVLGKTIELFTTIVKVVIPLVIQSFNKISKWFVENGPAIVERLQKFAKRFGQMADIVQAVWVNILGPTFSLLSDAILGIASLVLAVANGDWANAWGDMKVIVGAMADATGSLVGGLLETIANAMGGSLADIGPIWSSNWDSLKEIVSLTLGEMVKSITSIEWFAIGSSVMTMFSTGIKALLGDIANTINMIITIITTAISNTEWFNFGSDIISGIQAGVVGKAGELANTMRTIAQQTLDSFKQAIGSNSPAKAFIPTGNSIPQGVAMGVSQGTSVATQAITNMGQMLLGQQGIGSIGAMGQQVVGSQTVQSPTTNNTQSNTFNNNVSGGMELAQLEAIIKRVVGAGI